ncbi:MAG: peptidylprolyl isomerase, partial [Parasphingopyxis sp.]|nr:peptidylprolyl isomerase [Sphingomonadales bacterium]
EQTYARVASNFAPNVDDFDAFLREQGSSERSIKRQIEGELAWDRLLRRNFSAEVSDAQVEEIVQRLQDNRGQTEYRVSEIYLAASPGNQDQILARANQIIEQLRQGGSFPAYARQYSDATTAAVGGDLGWLLPGQLPNELAQAVVQMPVGSLSPPISVPGGFSIIAVSDSRQILTVDPRDAVLSLKQITVSFPPGTQVADAEPRIETLTRATQTGTAGCGAAESIAGQVGGDVVQNDNVRVRDLPPELQQMMGELQIGQSTPPFGSLTEGVRVLILCGRDDPPQTATIDPQQIEETLRADRRNRQAISYLRDLRANAIIEYR